ncbi:MAG: methyltransferase domain-containing protein [Cryomorphaceae bacterium]|jgi:2-polyprenyl-3-methyl-5-hydroxy-6-metoxy-1,4-benzoquinol methylase|nr:methyltransferase domain-containing protein [Cryomorphaceae bacterium]
MQKEWFAEWFDTPYYHILYKNRDDAEAEKFISNLLKYLSIPKGSKVLDLACGKGRHSQTLFKHGYEVTAVDLSQNSIQTAKETVGNNVNITFEVRDMREAFTENTFDAVFNLFTSFGYFDSLEDNQKVIDSTKKMLVKNGLLIIDFMNAKRVVNELVPQEVKTVDGIEFSIRRNYDGAHITKDIKFYTEDREFKYSERVQALQLNDFSTLLENSGFEILHTFGDFDLNPYHAETSDRLIIVAKK